MVPTIRGHHQCLCPPIHLRGKVETVFCLPCQSTHWWWHPMVGLKRLSVTTTVDHDLTARLMIIISKCWGRLKKLRIYQLSSVLGRVRETESVCDVQTWNTRHTSGTHSVRWIKEETSCEHKPCLLYTSRDLDTKNQHAF